MYVYNYIFSFWVPNSVMIVPLLKVLASDPNKGIIYAIIPQILKILDNVLNLSILYINISKYQSIDVLF